MKYSFIYMCFGLLLMFASCETEEKVSIKLATYELHMEVGEQVQLEAQVSPIDWYGTHVLVWKSSDTSVATIDNKGNIKAIYSGECIITVKAGDVWATCKVVVGDLSYQLTFTQAKAFLYGDAHQVGANNATLRLYQDGITVDDSGAISGLGLFINIDLNFALADQSISAGGYSPKDDGSEQTYFPGEIYMEDGVSYAVGTFLGEYKQEGFGVVFIQNGVISVAKSGSRYIVDGILLGLKNEAVTIHYEGEIPHIDLSGGGEPPVEITFDIATVEMTHQGTTDQAEQYKLRFRDKGGLGDVLCEVNVPIGVEGLIPTGAYKVNASGQPFSLSLAEGDATNQGSWYDANGTYVKIISGELVVAGGDQGAVYSFTFIDNQQRILKGSLQATPTSFYPRLKKAVRYQ